MHMNIRLFRRNNKQSFSVQLSPSSGIVEVHCVEGNVAGGGTIAHELEDLLLRIGRDKFFHLGGFEAPYGGGWQVQLVRLGQFSIKARGFVQCKLRFSRVQQQPQQLHSSPPLLVKMRPKKNLATAKQRKVPFKWAARSSSIEKQKK